MEAFCAGAAGFVIDLMSFGVGASSEARVASSWFSWELAGSRTSLLGTGVESFVGFLDFGRALAFVVSCRQEEGEAWALCETFARGEDAGAAGPPGDDFWKKDMMVRCFAEAVFWAGVAVAAFDSLPGVWAPATALSEAIVDECHRRRVRSETMGAGRCEGR